LSSFDLFNLALDRIVRNKTETGENTRHPMGDWTSQNWTKRDGRNNQQQEKKATYKTAAELAVKKSKLKKNHRKMTVSSLKQRKMIHFSKSFQC
jgi:hypothetical protein